MIPTAAESMLLGNTREALDPGRRAARHVIDFLRWIFSGLPAGSYHFDVDAQDKGTDGSEIYIAYESPVDPVKVGARPAICASVGALSFSGLGIGDTAYVDWATGAKTRMDLIPTTLGISVLTTKSVEATKLAWFCVEQIWMYREEIVKTEDSLHYLGARPVISTPSAPGSLMVPSTEEEWVACTAQFPMYVTHCATTLPMNKRILREARFTAKTSTSGVR